MKFFAQSIQIILLIFVVLSDSLAEEKWARESLEEMMSIKADKLDNKTKALIFQQRYAEVNLNFNIYKEDGSVWDIDLNNKQQHIFFFLFFYTHPDYKVFKNREMAADYRMAVEKGDDPDVGLLLRTGDEMMFPSFAGLYEVPVHDGSKPLNKRYQTYRYVDEYTGKIYERKEEIKPKILADRIEHFKKIVSGKINFEEFKKSIHDRIKNWREPLERAKYLQDNPPPPPPRPRIPAGWPQDQPEEWKPIPGVRGELARQILSMKDPKEWDALSNEASDATTRARQAFQARVNPGKNNNSLTDEQMREYWKNKDGQLWKEYLEVKKHFVQLHDLNSNGIIEGIEIKPIQDRYLKLRELRDSDPDAEVAELMKIEIEFFDLDGDGALGPAEYKLAERFTEKLIMIPSKFGSHDKVFKEDF